MSQRKKPLRIEDFLSAGLYKDLRHCQVIKATVKKGKVVRVWWSMDLATFHGKGAPAHIRAMEMQILRREFKLP